MESLSCEVFYGILCLFLPRIESNEARSLWTSSITRKTPKLAQLIVSTFLLTIITLSCRAVIRDSQKISESNSQAFESIRHDSVTSKPCSGGKINSRGCNSSDGDGAVSEQLPGIQENNPPPLNATKLDLATEENCDLFSGEWVPNPEAPYYTNMTCNVIQEHQNCMRFGRPDGGFLKWKWKPDGCELPIFHPYQFLELVRGKSIAFVGDSVARNHMQSLICLLSRVAYPMELSSPTDANTLRKYREYNFNISIFWFRLRIISAGQWFFRPTYFHLNHSLVGCLYCPEANVTHLTSSFSYRQSFRTAFHAINEAKNFKGITYLRTFAPSHFEGGEWDKGGDCTRTRPFKRNETLLDDLSSRMYSIQLEELKTAQEEAWRKNGLKFRLFDAKKPMLLRSDGHPSKYGHWPVQNVTLANDCVHWCLAGPIDSWNDFLQELLKRETQNDKRLFK
ncbi:Hypothetical predicted protein [Olea europaea subsp. europaea]|uniref:Trichome birefringence-like N-terminal domain-containing protein n=1 Tax=Olea europaea subsp. europaea TaxID=158383 RepID=A0A8S0V8P5_OLEEU|nr:Hypothetical predicted protein [Olea europaea subsp. europaea]